MLNVTFHYQYTSPTAQNILANLYVDNIVSGCSSESEATSYYNKAWSIMNNGHINLRSWASNSPQLKDQVNVLGLQWNILTDTLSLTSKLSIPDVRSHPDDAYHLDFKHDCPAYLDLSVRSTTQASRISSSSSRAGVSATAGRLAKNLRHEMLQRKQDATSFS